MVWKYIKELKNEGYCFDSVKNKGYRLLQGNDVLNSFEILDKLGHKTSWKDVRCYEKVDSTNSLAKRIAAEELGEKVVIVAECQISGRGRLGRNWSSIPGKGIWMSIILRPKLLPKDVQIITLAAGVAVVRSIKQVTGISTGIKWPNDIVVNGQKICGILTEMSTEMDSVNYIIVGIGLNVLHEEEDFPEEIREAAGSLKMAAGDKVLPQRSVLLSNILAEFDIWYEKIAFGFTQDIISEWKNHSVTLGKQVRVININEEFRGKAIDIASDGSLVVDCGNGTVHEVSSGEISIRGMKGYV